MTGKAKHLSTLKLLKDRKQLQTSMAITGPDQQNADTIEKQNISNIKYPKLTAVYMLHFSMLRVAGNI